MVHDWGLFQLHHGDCLGALRQMEANSVDSIVTDPPYGLSFMGKKWDYDVPSVEIWAECLRVLKPGGHLLAFAGTRTQHRMAVRIEDAGFEIRDMLAWVYGSGFPKSLDVSKALDKAAGAEREVIGTRVKAGIGGPETFAQDAWTQANRGPISLAVTAPATDAARQWAGWGTALKPAFEPITLARKPLIGTVAANVLAHGVGGLNIDGCRVPGTGDHMVFGTVTKKTTVTGDTRDGAALGMYGAGASFTPKNHAGGRFPANLIHDGSDEVLAAFPTPAPARFFYCAKASKSDRGEGNNHPTVKPTDLMRYLVTLVTPPGGLVLDPFMGSGSTGKAAVAAGVRFTGIERDQAYFDLAERRIAEPIFGKGAQVDDIA